MKKQVKEKSVHLSGTVFSYPHLWASQGFWGWECVSLTYVGFNNLQSGAECILSHQHAEIGIPLVIKLFVPRYLKSYR